MMPLIYDMAESNLHFHKHRIPTLKEDRNKQSRGLWFTGLSGSGRCSNNATEKLT